MADTNTTELDLLLMQFDTHDNDWGEKTNLNLQWLNDAIGPTDTHSTTGGTTALTTAAQVRKPIHRITGTLLSNAVFEVPAARTKWYWWQNATAGAFSVTVKVPGQPGVVIPQGESRLLRCDGTDVVDLGFVSTGAQTGKGQWVGTLGFTTDAYTAAANGYIPATLVDGLTIHAFIDDANATTTPTLNYAATGAKAIVRSTGVALVVGELADGMVAEFIYKLATDKWYVNVNPTVDTGAMTGAVTFSGIITPTQIVANTNNYTPTGHATATRWRLSTDASRNITGVIAGASGRLLILGNIGSFNIVLLDANTGSLAANRFDFGGDVTLKPKATALIIYDITLARWRMLATWGGTTTLTYTEYDKGTVQLSHNFTQAHGLGAYPSAFDVYLECTTTDVGFSVGDRVKMATAGLVPAASLYRGGIAYMDTTNVNFQMDEGLPYFIQGTTIVASRWKVIFRVFA